MIRSPGSILRMLAAALLVLATISCGSETPPPWTDREMQDHFNYFEQAGKAYALVDICMPMVEADAEAKYQLVSAIKADRYAKLLQINTLRERERLFSFFAGSGGTAEQNQSLRDHYADAYSQASDEITSVQVCVDTIKDFANTIINIRVT